jgi:calnexin
MPDVAAGLAAAFFTLLGMVAALFGLIGSSKPVVSHHPRRIKTQADEKVKKTQSKTKAVVAKEPAPVAVDATPVASADDLKTVDVTITKRTTRATKE